MQTDASPREPFTLGVLFSYKATIVIVAALVIVSGYVRIVTQPPLYEATARLAVRFPAEAMELQELGARNSFYRLPLLEEEVKAYMVQLKDPQFIAAVLKRLADDAAKNPPPAEVEEEPGAAERFRDQFLQAYYDFRRAVLAFLDTVLLTPAAMLSPKQQEVMTVLSRLGVEAGAEASHIIDITHKNRGAALAARIVNTIADEFILVQKARIQPRDEKKFEAELQAANAELVGVKVKIFELQNKLGSATPEEAITYRRNQLTLLETEKRKLEIAKKLFAMKIIAYDRELPLISQVVIGELESSLMDILVRYDEQAKRDPRENDFYKGLAVSAEKILDNRRLAVIERDGKVVDERVQWLDEEIQSILGDRRHLDLIGEYARLTAEETAVTARVTKAQTDLQDARRFNEQLQSENVSESITLWQPAQVPPFPLPQYRGIKLVVILALGVFAGCIAALGQHQIRPKRIRKARPRQAQEVSVPIVLLPDEAKRKSAAAQAPQVDITFPPHEGPSGTGFPGGTRK